jgi:DNA-binding NarL/FixJ family response regulator
VTDSERDRALNRDLEARARLAADPIAQIVMNRDPTHRPAHRLHRATALSPPEIEVLRYLSRGLEYEMVADALGKNLETIKSQARGARTKLQAKNSAEACCEAVRRGLIP